MNAEVEYFHHASPATELWPGAYENHKETSLIASLELDAKEVGCDDRPGIERRFLK
jgi:hypothetical protein